MSKLTIGQKAQRILRFLLGLRTLGVIAILAEYGFTEEHLRRGVELLAAVTRLRLRAGPASPAPSLIKQLDQFENRWFQIARVTLSHNYPELAEQFFKNLVQTTGINVAVTVGVFIERLDQLASPTGLYGEQGPAARALLAERGLTEERVDQARTLVQTLSTFLEDATIPTGTAEREAAEQAMWSWYLEWSGIARAVIHEKRMLRALGFRKGRNEAIEEETEATEDQPELQALPVSSVGVIVAPTKALAASNEPGSDKDRTAA